LTDSSGRGVAASSSVSRSPRIEGIGVAGWHARAVRNRRVINTQRRTIRWLSSIREAPRAVNVDYWVEKQIHAANILGAESAGDPWPNCPDPYDGRGSWQATVNCENNGNWYDSPGYYRCGLQFDPMWERRFGRLCP